MLLGGDELGREQGGNNNAYCQDNEVSWMDWEYADLDLFAFVKKLLALRRDHPAFRKRHFNQRELGWYRNDGQQMTSVDWSTPWAKTIALFLSGANAAAPDNDFYLAFNPHSEPLHFIVPAELGRLWRVVINTSSARLKKPVTLRGATFWVDSHSMLVLAR